MLHVVDKWVCEEARLLLAHHDLTSQDLSIFGRRLDLVHPTRPPFGLELRITGALRRAEVLAGEAYVSPTHGQLPGGFRMALLDGDGRLEGPVFEDDPAGARAERHPLRGRGARGGRLGHGSRLRTNSIGSCPGIRRSWAISGLRLACGGQGAVEPSPAVDVPRGGPLCTPPGGDPAGSPRRRRKPVCPPIWDMPCTSRTGRSMPCKK